MEEYFSRFVSVWGPWEGGCASHSASCTAFSAEAHRSCCCEINRGLQWEGEDAQAYCGHLGGSTTREEQCPAKPCELNNILFVDSWF